MSTSQTPSQRLQRALGNELEANGFCLAPCSRVRFRYPLKLMNRLAKILILSIAVSLGGVLVACGGVPSNSVATVADDPITKDTFNKWMAIAAKSQGQQNPGAPVVVPDAPDFVNCVAQKQAALPKATAKAPAPSPAQLKSECQAQFDQQKGQVMQLLITSAWIEGQAKAMGVTVSDAEVRKQFDKTKKGAFPTDAAYQKFLKQSGEAESDILFRIRIDVLSTKIRDAALKGTDQVSNDAISKYYADHLQQFGQPETRDIAVIQTKSKADAQKAQAALSANFSNWAAVAKQYSGDKASVATGGVKRGVVQGQDPNFTQAFAEKLNGAPIIIHTADGSYDLVRVVAINKGVVQPLDKAKASIVQALKQTQQQTTLQNFVKSFQASWKKRTLCAKIYIVDLCGNAPKAAAQPGAGTTQQAPPQQAPTGP